MLVPTVTDEIDAALLAQAGANLKLIANFGNGVDNIDVQAALSRGITVTNTPGVLTDDTADMTMALILAVARRIAGRGAHDPGGHLDRLVADLDARPPHHRQAPRHRRHGPHRPGPGPPGAGLRPVDPLSQPPPGGRCRSRRSSRRPTGRASTRCWPAWTSSRCNCPHTPATYHLLSARRLKLMKPDAIIVNTARGEIIDETALARLLEAGDIGGAGLDVFEHEPAVNPRLVKLARQGKVVLLPHMGSATHEGRVDMGEKVIVNIKTFMDGHRPPDRVLPSML